MVNHSISEIHFNNIMAPNSVNNMDLLGEEWTMNDEKRAVGNKTLKRPRTPCINSPNSKRRRTLSEDSEHRSPMLDIIRAVENLSTDSTLVADGSRVSCLPTIEGKHKDLKSISPKTMSDVLEGQYDSHIDRVTVIDCRYPYEYDGGHIDGAVNLYTKDAIQEFLTKTKVANNEVHVLIFHCEFSSERGPKMFRFLRQLDREMNKETYPHLNFPEVYLLEGGYKAFYQSFQAQCKPQAYVPMLHENHGKDLRHFRVKSKSWTAGDKPRPSFRAGALGKKLF